jgi:hypothetical protein
VKTRTIHISKLDDDRPLYIRATLSLPGIGEIEMENVVSQETVERLFREIETLAAERIRGNISPAPKEEA